MLQFFGFSLAKSVSFASNLVVAVSTNTDRTLSLSPAADLIEVLDLRVSLPTSSPSL